MIKHLLTVEFRYNEIPKSDLMSEHASKTITIGVYDTIEEAIANGNECVKILSKDYRFSHGFRPHAVFGKPDDLVVDMNYGVFIKITPLKFDGLEETMKEVAESNAKYEKWSNQ